MHEQKPLENCRDNGFEESAVKKFKLFIFDCDGVLVDSEPVSAAAHKAAYAAHQVDLPNTVMARCVGMKQTDIIKLIAEEIGFVLPESDVPRIWQEAERLMRVKLEPTNGIIDFLGSDKTNRCVASSSAMERIALSLNITKVDQQFQADHFYNSAMVKNGKPAPDLFLHAAHQCSTEPQACAVFEDSIYGIQGAMAAGMTPFGYVGGSHCGPGHDERLAKAGAAAVFHSWAEAKAYLQSSKHATMRA